MSMETKKYGLQPPQNISEQNPLGENNKVAYQQMLDDAYLSVTENKQQKNNPAAQVFISTSGSKTGKDFANEKDYLTYIDNYFNDREKTASHIERQAKNGAVLLTNKSFDKVFPTPANNSEMREFFSVSEVDSTMLKYDEIARDKVLDKVVESRYDVAVEITANNSEQFLNKGELSNVTNMLKQHKYSVSNGQVVYHGNNLESKALASDIANRNENVTLKDLNKSIVRGGGAALSQSGKFFASKDGIER